MNVKLICEYCEDKKVCEESNVQECYLKEAWETVWFEHEGTGILNQVVDNMISSRWRPISDPPEEACECLVCVKHGSSRHAIIAQYTPCYDGFSLHLEGKSCFYDYDSEYGDCEVSNITHWMPSPDLPEDSDEDGSK